MAEAVVATTPRQGLNARQAETVERLLDAGEAELEEVGPDELSIRNVARRAGVSSATAYTYFASKHHLFAEIYWRRLQAETWELPAGSALDRVRAITQRMVDVVASSPHLATAANMALLGSDPEVDRLRIKIGAAIVQHFIDALGDPTDTVRIDALTYAFSGVLLQAGMGLLTYEETGDRLDAVIAVILEGYR